MHLKLYARCSDMSVTVTGDCLLAVVVSWDQIIQFLHRSSTAMDKHQVLLARFIGVVALVVGVAQVTTAIITCYRCTDGPGGFPFEYDPECSEYTYNGLNDTSNYDACFIEILDEGHFNYLRRDFGSSGHADGDCVYGPGYTRCYCKEDLCNTESYCSQCGYPKPTPGTSTTIEVTILTTTKPPPSTTTEVTIQTTIKLPTSTTTQVTTLTTTKPPPSTTTDVTTLTTTKPPPSTITEVTTTTNPPPLTTDDTTLTSTTTPGILSCYECIGCPNVDSSTPMISDASYLSCTTVVLNNANVIRGGSHEHHPDGECTVDSEIVYCWCSSNLCNNIKI